MGSCTAPAATKGVQSTGQANETTLCLVERLRSQARGTLGTMTAALDELDEEQRAAATALTGPVCIIAGAGTGKTRTVTPSNGPSPVPST